MPRPSRSADQKKGRVDARVHSVDLRLTVARRFPLLRCMALPRVSRLFRTAANLLLLATAVAVGPLVVHADDWPQWLGPQRDGEWRETGILEKFPADGLKVRWRVPIGGGYTGPAVANGRVYVMDRQSAPGTSQPPNAFARGELAGTERVLCLDEATGKVVWQHAYDCTYTVSYASGPRATPVIH